MGVHQGTVLQLCMEIELPSETLNMFQVSRILLDMFGSARGLQQGGVEMGGLTECQGLRSSSCLCWLFSADNKIAWRVSHEIELFYRKYYHLGYCQALSIPSVFLLS